MAVEAITWVLKRARGIKAGPRCVLLVLANYSDAEGWCYPSVAHLADMVEMKRDTVRQSLRKLETAGLITTEKHPGQRSRYRVHWTDPARKTGTPEKRTNPARKTDPNPTRKTGLSYTKGDTKGNTKGLPSWKIDDYEIPEVVDTPLVREALQRWLDYRRARRLSGYLKSGWILQAAQRCDLDPVRFIAAIDRCGADGLQYAGIFPESAAKRHAAPAKVDPSARKIKTRRTES